MKYLLLLFIISIGCKHPSEKDISLGEMAVQAIKICDSTYARDSALITKQHTLLKVQHNIMLLQIDSLESIRIRCDSLRSALKVQNYRVGRIKYYVNICNKKPSQDKFLRGWINRTLQ